MTASRHLLLLAGLLAAGGALAQPRPGTGMRARTLEPPLQEVLPMPMPSDRSATTPRLRTWVQGWTVTGSNPSAYEVRCDDIAGTCALPILRTKWSAGEPYGFGALTHSESAVPWRGLRLELRAELKGGRIDGWAGVWMRVDGADGKVLAFDNMQNRPIRGTTGYDWYSVVLEVPKDAEQLSFGVLLHGPGAIFIREIQFDEASGAARSTDLVGPLRAQK